MPENGEQKLWQNVEKHREEITDLKIRQGVHGQRIETVEQNFARIAREMNQNYGELKGMIESYQSEMKTDMNQYSQLVNEAIQNQQSKRAVVQALRYLIGVAIAIAAVVIAILGLPA